MGARATQTPKTLEKALTDTLASQILGGDYRGPFLCYDEVGPNHFTLMVANKTLPGVWDCIASGETVLDAFINAKARNPELWRKKK